MKLNEIWAILPPSESVIVVYDNPAGTVFWPFISVYPTWKDTWDYDEKTKSLVDKLTIEPIDKLISFSGFVTPDRMLITLSLNPVAVLLTYPTSLRQLADNTNPAMLWFIQNHDFTLPRVSRIGMVSLDFVSTTCIVDLTLQLNGVQGTSLTGCKIGMYVGNWLLWHAKRPCPGNFTEDISHLFCNKPEPAYTRAGYPWKFGDKPFDLSAAWQRCEADHFAGRNETECEVNGAIVYPKCQEGFHNVGCCVCSFNCPPYSSDTGVACQK